MSKLQLIPLALAALVSLFFGVRYFLTKEFMAYHAVVSGKSWAQLEAGVQTIILGMLKIVGGGFVAYGVAVLWLLLPLDRGERWAAWAILSISAAVLVPVLYVTIALRRYEPKAKTPVLPTAVVLLLVVVGAGAALLR